MSKLAQQAAFYAAHIAGSKRIGLGCMGLAGVYGGIDQSTAIATLNRALNLGITLFDTAPLYVNGYSEELVGAVIGNMPDVTVATKFGLEADRTGALIRNSRPQAIRKSVEASLRRLRRERIDLLLQHREDLSVSNEAIAETLNRLVEEGKVDKLGLSAVTLKRAQEFVGFASMSAVQNELSASSDLKAGNLAKDFAEQGLVFMAHSPLSRGVLAKGAEQAFPAGDFRKNMAILSMERQRKILMTAKSKGIDFSDQRTRIRSALDWVVKRGTNVVAIVGAKSPEQISDLTLVS